MSNHDQILALGEKLCDNQRPAGLAEVRAYLIQKKPAFASLLFGLYRHVFIEGNVIDTAAMDGKHLYMSIKFWEQLDVAGAAFVTAHEILHGVLDHPERMIQLRAQGFDGKQFQQPLYNDAADYVINDMLIEAGFAMTGILNGQGLHDVGIARSTNGVDETYRKLYEDQPQGQGQGQGQSPPDPNAPKGQPGKGSFDGVLDPAPDAASKPAVDREVATALAIAKQQGDASAGLLKAFEGILQPKISWKHLLRQAFHASRGRSRSTWRRLNRRFLPQGILLAGRDGVALGTVAVAFDTSGSVSAAETQAYLAEVRSILEELTPKELWAIPCDARVYTPHKLKTPAELLDFAKGAMKGGGGTRFEPVFNWIADNNVAPEVLLFCTDMYGSFPAHAPRYPVIWVSTGGTKAPFGKLIQLEL